MPPRNLLRNRLQKDFSSVIFKDGDSLYWSSRYQTIYLPHEYDDRDLLHELGHALSRHTGYQQDIQLLRMEREAWNKAVSVASRYEMTIEQDFIEEALDSYRDWLYRRSMCPQCKQTGIHAKTGTYQCLNCRCRWRANDARLCALKRYKMA